MLFVCVCVCLSVSFYTQSLPEWSQLIETYKCNNIVVVAFTRENWTLFSLDNLLPKLRTNHKNAFTIQDNKFSLSLTFTPSFSLFPHVFDSLSHHHLFDLCYSYSAVHRKLYWRFCCLFYVLFWCCILIVCRTKDDDFECDHVYFIETIHSVLLICMLWICLFVFNSVILLHFR